MPLPIRAICIAAGMLLAPLQAQALTCEAFVEGLSSATARKGGLPKPTLRKTTSGLEDHFQIENYSGITAAVHCPAGEFKEFGFTLGEGSQKARDRYALLFLTALKSAAPAQGDRQAFAGRLQDEAIGKADAAKAGGAFWAGRADEAFGPLDVGVFVAPGTIQVEIEMVR